MTKRVLICGNPDLNYIDGSSIWSETIARATAATGIAQVEFLSRSTPLRDELYSPLKSIKNLTIIDGSDRKYWSGKGFSRITPAMMGDLAIRLDRANPYDVIIVRGLDIATKIQEVPATLSKCWMYLTDIPQRLEDYSTDQRHAFQRIAHGCHRLLCQTQGFKVLWQSLVPDLDASKVRLYTPVIPDLTKALPSLAERPLRAIYAGKFKGDWMTLEMAEQWPVIHAQLPSSELVVIGDKIHDEPDIPTYQQRMRKALESTSGLRWLGALSRDAVQQQLQQARVGLSWRDESMNDTLEYSTKILEYGGAGCAVILNRNPLHEQLLGQDYPLFANSPEDFTFQLARALGEPAVVQQAADTLQKLAQCHTFSTRVGEIRQWLEETPKAPATKSKTRVLVAGHDLKFFTLLKKKLEASGQFEFLIDQWQGHNQHDEAQSRALLEQADVIFCEWCLGNLKWYSHHKKPQQRLVARFHLQERELPYVAEANWDNINHISYVSEFIRREGQKVFGFPFEKTSVIPNLLDETKFSLKKKTGDARYTLGMVGVVPARKRLDRALDLLEALLEEDERYCLRIKGKHPLDYSWLLSREDELVYFRNIFKRINSNPKIRYKVIFDPAGDDINDWFTMVGFVLSPSDFESFHMAIGEGMLTGAFPLIWNWDGAEEIWGERFVVSSVVEAKKLLLSHGGREESLELPQELSSDSVVSSWLKILRYERE
ncbi:glycosyltransferase family protein [Halomonas eurihalina]|uniref:glycosyltransferase family protein n=1 Tax=Halomonas eurihalina TaxID=42566 RepID=UPI0016594B02|nr:glycosyltransferase family 1 protein [Halomonas eurihalina]MDR5860830.1 hypothetical protein [Halomonas eurihalina]